MSGHRPPPLQARCRGGIRRRRGAVLVTAVSVMQERLPGAGDPAPG
ncbi:hypothetical protein RC1_0468 [Rhodospirillum centenum SW]|uniref:Uncharacterized protein n=1 Tax=Rhodospirillum centenum (strain ATCC 51521 / SW) TaxID=414684 RepID=B6IR19_RHOCS|nr:hypothetical protein RC1_0468 [Rhodospirillum centenum SW]